MNMIAERNMITLNNETNNIESNRNIFIVNTEKIVVNDIEQEHDTHFDKSFKVNMFR